MVDTTQLAVDSGPSDIPLLRQTIGDNLRATAARYPGNDAVVSVPQGLRLDYSQLDEAVDRLAFGLLEAGVAKGERVGVWSPNNLEWVLIQYATARIGAILVNINPAYRTSELVYALNQSECRYLISAEKHLKSDYREMLSEVGAELPHLERIWFLDSPEWEDLVNTKPDRAALGEVTSSLSPDDPINIQYTSGTTGFPKGATLSHLNILNNAFFVGEACRYRPEDRVCIPVPFYHCFGMVLGNLACTTHGATIVIPSAHFESGWVLTAVEKERCTSLYGVPTMFIAELADEEFDGYDLSSLRTGIMAGAPCPVEVMKRVVTDMHMTEVTIAYGMTETSPVSTQTRPDDDIDRRVSTVGRVHPHVEVKIVHPESGSTVRRGEPGELCTRGYSVMLGYWNEPERTAETVDADGWLHSGDLATMDGDGYIKIVGRIKDMIIRGGENIYPREIEEFIYTHPDVEDVQVVGVPDVRFGEQVMAWVKPRDGSELTEADIIEYCRGRIAHYKIPAYVAFVTEFPMTVTGKIQKFRLREMAGALTTDVQKAKLLS